MKKIGIFLVFSLLFIGVAIVNAQNPQLSSGEKIFNKNCRVCHINGGNVINPSIPIRGSFKLANIETFKTFIRNPKLPDGSKGAMPSFSKSQISDDQVKDLYQYIISDQGLNLTSRGSGGTYCPYCGQYLGSQRGYGMGHGMMRGYGMGSGMMGRGYGMGSGMMGGYGMGGYGMGSGMMMEPGYYNQSEACQKFLDDTSKMRKELYNKRYDYFEAARNPKSSTETVEKMEKKIRELQEKIYSKAPQGCW
jgi:hypothetical protein